MDSFPELRSARIMTSRHLNGQITYEKFLNDKADRLNIVEAPPKRLKEDEQKSHLENVF